MPEAAEIDDRSARDRRFSAKSSPPCWPPAFPFPLPLPVLTSRRARAPKLKRRAKGVDGTLELSASPSSNGLSSTDPEFALERLSVRGRAGVNGEL